MRPALRATVVGLVVVTAAIIGTFVVQSGPSSARSIGAAPQAPPRSTPSVDAAPRGELGRATTADGALTQADGVLPDGATVFDDQDPGIANLDADLLYALRVATRKAADDEIELTINSGWRSRSYQDALLSSAISEYGSLEEAERWVATADTSPHVSGDAVDIGSAAGTTWLCFTDQVLHAALAGHCALEQTFHLDIDAMAHPDRAPIRVLEKMTGRALA